MCEYVYVHAHVHIGTCVDLLTKNSDYTSTHFYEASPTIEQLVENIGGKH